MPDAKEDRLVVDYARGFPRPGRAWFAITAAMLTACANLCILTAAIFRSTRFGDDDSAIGVLIGLAGLSFCLAVVSVIALLVAIAEHQFGKYGMIAVGLLAAYVILMSVMINTH